MPSALFLLDTGFETMEALSPIDILRRSKLDVTVASASDSTKVVSGQNVTVICDCALDAIAAKTFDVVVLPGGMPNAKLLGENQTVVDILKKHQQAGKWIAAICASPALVLAANGFFKNGAKGVCYPLDDFHKIMTDQNRVPNADTYIDRDHKIVTARGPGCAIEFGFAISSVLGVESSGVKSAMLLS